MTVDVGGDLNGRSLHQQLEHHGACASLVSDLQASIDGELVTLGNPLAFRIRPRVLRVIVPVMRTLVHLSDLHFGRIDPVVVDVVRDTVQAIAPDLIAVSGDFTQRARCTAVQRRARISRLAAAGPS